MAAFLLVVLPLMAAVFIAEGAVRWREAHRTIPPGTWPTLFYLHQRLQPALTHNRHYFGWINVDSSGLRGREVSVPHRPGTIRILADGGSTTFDPAVTADDSTWPSQLERQLNTNHGERPPVEVLNAGVPSYFVLDNSIRLQTDLYRFKPDVIVLLQGHNDLNAALVDNPPGNTDTPDAQIPIAPWYTWLSQHSLLWGKLAAARRALAARLWPDSDIAPGRDPAKVDSLLAGAAAQFGRDLAIYVATAKLGGAKVILLEPVHLSGGAATPRDTSERKVWEHYFSGVPAEVVLRGYARFSEVIRQVADSQGAVFIPTAAFGVQGAEYYDPGDPIHFNDRGARRFAEQLAPVLDSLVLQETAPTP
jgi:lysophospholipase L1-like esterase